MKIYLLVRSWLVLKRAGHISAGQFDRPAFCSYSPIISYHRSPGLSSVSNVKFLLRKCYESVTSSASWQPGVTGTRPHLYSRPAPYKSTREAGKAGSWQAGSCKLEPARLIIEHQAGSWAGQLEASCELESRASWETPRETAPPLASWNPHPTNAQRKERTPKILCREATLLPTQSGSWRSAGIGFSVSVRF